MAAARKTFSSPLASWSGAISIVVLSQYGDRPIVYGTRAGWRSAGRQPPQPGCVSVKVMNIAGRCSVRMELPDLAMV
ncbi:hypothetical protein ABZW11_13845 [Nonomuraea sp. NPDC004580]|uniref:hypothetical protein n=1 Tax=Nonomuraea sp. NPDC004580 TaxID=3154552 RepID=UPI0033AFEFFE